MIKTKIRQGFLDQVKAVQNIWKDELLEGKVQKITYGQFEEISRSEPTAFTRLNLVFNPSSTSTKSRLIHDYTSKVNQTTLSLELLTSEKCIGSLAEAHISFRMHYWVKCRVKTI